MNRSDRIVSACRLWQHRYMRRNALSLIEVMAALVILGGAATTMLVAQANSVEQLGHSRLQLIAKHLAGELIATWQAEGEDLRIAGNGQVSGVEGWSWRRTNKTVEPADGVSSQMVTLEMIYEDREGLRPAWARKFFWLVRNETIRDTTSP